MIAAAPRYPGRLFDGCGDDVDNAGGYVRDQLQTPLTSFADSFACVLTERLPAGRSRARVHSAVLVHHAGRIFTDDHGLDTADGAVDSRLQYLHPVRRGRHLRFRRAIGAVTQLGPLDNESADPRPSALTWGARTIRGEIDAGGGAGHRSHPPSGGAVSPRCWPPRCSTAW